MIELPQCRWRAARKGDTMRCSSPKIAMTKPWADAAVCLKCPYKDHAPVASAEAAAPKPQVSCPEAYKAVPRPDCDFLGKAFPGQKVPCGRKLRECEVHGLCTTLHVVLVNGREAACCATCKQREDP